MAQGLPFNASLCDIHPRLITALLSDAPSGAANRPMHYQGGGIIKRPKGA
jgi:hypothetical protein